eukprot:CAMPEP_0115127364 /NCGR_PEP_ID=MMETSP0227-20121206/50335_1 /TAXON_ID=89957 /ORGANISM="Polarella glacialis, Strain CCMP 1383" /LENGTH=157 /DNA_ID=CAMNT_0002531395 /DNA_START=45 /DNA_END=519 /DNA_ORIENTATION=+
MFALPLPRPGFWGFALLLPFALTFGLPVCLGASVAVPDVPAGVIGGEACGEASATPAAAPTAPTAPVELPLLVFRACATPVPHLWSGCENLHSDSSLHQPFDFQCRQTTTLRAGDSGLSSSDMELCRAVALHLEPGSTVGVTGETVRVSRVTPAGIP